MINKNTKALKGNSSNQELSMKETIARLEAFSNSTESLVKAYESWTKLEIEKEITLQCNIELQKVSALALVDIEKLKLEIKKQNDSNDALNKDKQADRDLLKSGMEYMQSIISRLLEMKEMSVANGLNETLHQPWAEEINLSFKMYSDLISRIPSRIP